VQGYLLLLSAINGFTADETASGEQAGAGGGPAGGDGQSQQEMAAMFAGYMGALPAEHFPNLRELAGEFSLADDGERFELLLDIFVDGLGRRARSGGR
jgi:hypothetical protein